MLVVALQFGVHHSCFVLSETLAFITLYCYRIYGIKVSLQANGLWLRCTFSVHVYGGFLIFFILFYHKLLNENYTICEITHFSTWKEMSIVVMIKYNKKKRQIQICMCDTYDMCMWIYGNNFFNGIQWQSDRGALCGVFSLFSK